MLANSYFILGPNGPTDIASAAITQRHTIPLVWAFLTASDKAQFVENDDNFYFELHVDDALKVLDRGMAAWNYNRYFRDTLAPVTVFRKWLGNFLPETSIYINVTELIRKSPTPHQDISSLRQLGGKVHEALENIEAQQFTHFINDLRMLAHPFITVPITGDRERDVYILTYEVRDTGTIEAEIALQMVGVDRDKSLLQRATEAIPKLLPVEEPSEITETKDPDPLVTMFAPAADTALLKDLFVNHLGHELEKETPRFLYFDANGRQLRVVKLTKPTVEKVEQETGTD